MDLHLTSLIHDKKKPNKHTPTKVKEGADLTVRKLNNKIENP